MREKKHECKSSEQSLTFTSADKIENNQEKIQSFHTTAALQI